MCDVEDINSFPREVLINGESWYKFAEDLSVPNPSQAAYLCLESIPGNSDYIVLKFDSEGNLVHDEDDYLNTYHDEIRIIEIVKN